LNAGGRGVASVASERANSKHGDAIKVMRCDVKIIGRSHVYMDGRGCQRGFRALEAIAPGVMVTETMTPIG
jgi:hypothetical protein